MAEETNDNSLTNISASAIPLTPPSSFETPVKRQQRRQPNTIKQTLEDQIETVKALNKKVRKQIKKEKKLAKKIEGAEKKLRRTNQFLFYAFIALLVVVASMVLMISQILCDSYESKKQTYQDLLKQNVELLSEQKNHEKRIEGIENVQRQIPISSGSSQEQSNGTVSQGTSVDGKQKKIR